ncbi:MAG: sulfatase [Deltaproteobacteria bacterium]|nr:sulfatase [Deltaproteobacteria bacterium]
MRRMGNGRCAPILVLAAHKLVGEAFACSLRLTTALCAPLAAFTAGAVARLAEQLTAAPELAIVISPDVAVLTGAIRALKRQWPTVRALAVAVPNQETALISVDTLRADHLGSYGSSESLTPHLDRLGADGVVFEHSITSSPWTLPAMASLFTGLYPRHHGAGTITNHRTPLGRAPLPPGSWTVATALRERGYRTHAIVTNPYLALHYGLGEGFDAYENITIESEAFLSFRETTAGRLLNWLRPDLVIGDRGETVSRRAQQWLATVDPAQPFLLWLHYLDPHPPYSRAGVTRHKSLRGDMAFEPATAGSAPLSLTSPDVARLRSGEIRLSDAEKESVRTLYRAEVASVDAAIGSVLDALDARGLREQTLVVCIADHGEEFWEHGGVEHGHTVYEELVRVPLLMRWPGRLPHTRIGQLTRIIDVAPTILDLLGPPAPAGLDGTSLVPLLRGEKVAPRTALTENMLFAEERVGLRTAGHKYVRWPSGKEEVYNLLQDPRELRDLAGIDAAVSPLRQLFAELDRSTIVRPESVLAPALGEKTRSALRALGYLH